MKFPTIAVFLTLFVAAWLPIIAQQPATASSAQAPAAADSSKPADKSACKCCSHKGSKDQASKSDSSGTCCHGRDGKSMSCCEGQDAKNMGCCKKDAQGKQSAANCCKGKDAKVCAKNGDKPCCGDSACKTCCGKSTSAANSGPSDSNCCAAANQPCCHLKPAA